MREFIFGAQQQNNRSEINDSIVNHFPFPIFINQFRLEAPLNHTQSQSQSQNRNVEKYEINLIN